MAAAVARVEAEAGAVGALVNNAGYAIEGAAEPTSMEEIRTAVRNQRLRSHAAVPARASGHAAARLGTHREHQLRRRQDAPSPAARTTTRRSTPLKHSATSLRFEVARLRRARDRRRARPDQDGVRRHGDRTHPARHAGRTPRSTKPSRSAWPERTKDVMGKLVARRTGSRRRRDRPRHRLDRVRRSRYRITIGCANHRSRHESSSPIVFGTR